MSTPIKVTYCLLHASSTRARPASTLVHNMPVCLPCYQRYAAESSQALAYAERHFYHRLVRAQRGRDVREREIQHVEQ